MKSAVCTLFEGDYHYGVAALCNSLYQNGYRGVVYAGYRGPLPPWAAGATKEKGYSEVAIQPQCRVRFVPLITNSHFANYKPDFMLSIWRDHCPGAEAVFYFDSDITVLCPWPFFEEWVDGGVALCADVYADMPATHPFRRAWMRYFGQYEVQLIREQNVYYNSGFVGVARQYRGFLNIWNRLIELVGPAIGGLGNPRALDRSYAFNIPDQDTLNAATMTCSEPLSCVGRKGMGFDGGSDIMSHAVDVKPWRKKLLWNMLASGRRPSLADKTFFKYVTFPIALYKPFGLFLKRLDVVAASAAGRYLG